MTPQAIKTRRPACLSWSRRPISEIVIEDPRTSTPGLGLLLWVKSVYSDKAPEAWAKLRRILTVRPAGPRPTTCSPRGSTDGAVLYYVARVSHDRDKTERYQAAAFSEGTTSDRVAGLIKASQNKDLARHFLKFSSWSRRVSMTPFDQQLDDAGIRDLRAAAGCLQANWSFLQRPSDEPAEVEKNRKAWIDEWLKATGRT